VAAAAAAVATAVAAAQLRRRRSGGGGRGDSGDGSGSGSGGSGDVSDGGKCFLRCRILETGQGWGGMHPRDRAGSGGGRTHHSRPLARPVCVERSQLQLKIVN